MKKYLNLNLRFDFSKSTWVLSGNKYNIEHNDDHRTVIALAIYRHTGILHIRFLASRKCDSACKPVLVSENWIILYPYFLKDPNIPARELW